MNASTADVPDMTLSEVNEVIIEDLRTDAVAAPASPHATERLIDAGYRSVLGVSTCEPDALVRIAFWSKRPRAFNRTHVPLPADRVPPRPRGTVPDTRKNDAPDR